MSSRHARINRRYYDHHVVECDGKVVHFNGSPASKIKAVIVEQSRETISGNLEELSISSCDPEVLREQVGQGGYNLFTNNCEHFADRATGGPGRSLQVEATAMIVTPVILSAAQTVLETGSVPEGIKAGVSEMPKSIAKYAAFRGARAIGDGMANSSSPLVQGLGRSLGRTNVAVATGVLAIETMANVKDLAEGTIDRTQFLQRTAEQGGALGGAIYGAKIGVALGSVCPVFGPVIGGIFGSILGGLFGRGMVQAVVSTGGSS